MLHAVRTTHRILAALLALTAVPGCGLKADRLTVAAPAPTSAAPSPASAAPSHAAAEPPPSPAATAARTSAEPAPPTTPPAAPPAATPAGTGPCAPRPPAASSVSLEAELSFPTAVVTPQTRGTLIVRNIGTKAVHVSGREYVGTATVDGDALTSTAASTSDYVSPVELRPNEERSYRVALVGHPCPGGQPDWDRQLPSGRYQVVALLRLEEVEGLSVVSDPIDVQYEAQ